MTSWSWLRFSQCKIVASTPVAQVNRTENPVSETSNKPKGTGWPGRKFFGCHANELVQKSRNQINRIIVHEDRVQQQDSPEEVVESDKKSVVYKLGETVNRGRTGFELVIYFSCLPCYLLVLLCTQFGQAQKVLGGIKETWNGKAPNHGEQPLWETLGNYHGTCLVDPLLICSTSASPINKMDNS